MPKLLTALLVCAFLVLSRDAAIARGATSEDAVRVEAWTAGVAMSIPGGWVLQMALSEIPDMPELLIVLHAQPPEPGVTCAMMLDRTDRPSLADHADSFRPEDPGFASIRLPAGEAVWWDEDEGGDDHATYYLLEAPEGVLMFMCGGLARPDDGWLSVVETIEFLPRPEE